jgi:hypothetical protein
MNITQISTREIMIQNGSTQIPYEFIDATNGGV